MKQKIISSILVVTLLVGSAVSLSCSASSETSQDNVSTTVSIDENSEKNVLTEKQNPKRSNEKFTIIKNIMSDLLLYAALAGLGICCYMRGSLNGSLKGFEAGESFEALQKGYWNYMKEKTCPVNELLPYSVDRCKNNNYCRDFAKATGLYDCLYMGPSISVS